MHRLLESTLLCHKSSSPKRRDLEVPFHAFQTDTTCSSAAANETTPLFATLPRPICDS